MAARGSEPRHIHLPCEMFVYMSKFLDFEDYRNFIRALIPDCEENEDIRKRLWQLSTHKYDATFCNEKQLEIEYNFDPERKPDDRVLVNVESLLPIFGGVVPPDESYSSCFCEGIGEEEDLTLSLQECGFGHFHHFCWRHVVWWLDDLNASILLVESSKAAIRLSVKSPTTYQNKIFGQSLLTPRVRNCCCKVCWPKRVWRFSD